MEAPNFLRLEGVPDNQFTYENPYLEPIHKKPKPKPKDELKEYMNTIMNNLKPHTNKLCLKLKTQMIGDNDYESNNINPYTKSNSHLNEGNEPVPTPLLHQKTKSDLYFEKVYSPSRKNSNSHEPENNLKRSFSYTKNMSSYLKNFKNLSSLILLNSFT